jgi:hypothetical protein
MNRLTHRVTQCSIDYLMTLDEALALEFVAHHERLEMVATTGRILHFHTCTGQSSFDHSPYFRSFHDGSYNSLIHSTISISSSLVAANRLRRNLVHSAGSEPAFVSISRINAKL